MSEDTETDRRIFPYLSPSLDHLAKVPYRFDLVRFDLYPGRARQPAVMTIFSGGQAMERIYPDRRECSPAEISEKLYAVDEKQKAFDYVITVHPEIMGETKRGTLH